MVRSKRKLSFAFRASSARCWRTFTSITSMINGSTSGGSDALPGDVIVVRYADDSIVGFEHRHEAEQFLADLKARLARFGLNLHPEKTRLIEFGRNAIASRRTRGLGKPETFDFLGLHHYCATRRGGSGFVLGRKPMAKRMRTKLREIKEQLMAPRP